MANKAILRQPLTDQARIKIMSYTQDESCRMVTLQLPTADV